MVGKFDIKVFWHFEVKFCIVQDSPYTAYCLQCVASPINLAEIKAIMLGVRGGSHDFYFRDRFPSLPWDFPTTHQHHCGRFRIRRSHHISRGFPIPDMVIWVIFTAKWSTWHRKRVLLKNFQKIQNYYRNYRGIHWRWRFKLSWHCS